MNIITEEEAAGFTGDERKMLASALMYFGDEIGVFVAPAEITGSLDLGYALQCLCRG